MTSLADLAGWQVFFSMLLVFGFAPGAVLRFAVRAYPKAHLRRRELVAELYALPYVKRPLFVAQQLETALFEGLPARWHQRRQMTASLSFSERLDAWRHRYLPLPDERVDEVLSEDEYVVHLDHPSFGAFLRQNLALILIVSIVGPIVVWRVSGQLSLLITVGAFLLLDTAVAVLALRRLNDRYTSYVITNCRLIRVTGVFKRSQRMSSVPWTQMTGLGYKQQLMGRLLGYATIFVDAAEEESGLREFSDVNDPATFHERILDMVSTRNDPQSRTPSAPTRGRRRGLLASWQAREQVATVRYGTAAEKQPRSRLSFSQRLELSRRRHLPWADELAPKLLMGQREYIVYIDRFLYRGVPCGSHIITNERLMRLTGILSRKIASMPLTDVNGVELRSNDRGEGDATVVVASAFWESGLREMRDVADPVRFVQSLRRATRTARERAERPSGQDNATDDA